MPRKHGPKFWIDVYHDDQDTGIMYWGVECDDPDYTFDGHYACLVKPTTEGIRKGKPDESARDLAEKIADALNRAPLRSK